MVVIFSVELRERELGVDGIKLASCSFQLVSHNNNSPAIDDVGLALCNLTSRLVRAWSTSTDTGATAEARPMRSANTC